MKCINPLLIINSYTTCIRPEAACSSKRDRAIQEAVCDTFAQLRIRRYHIRYMFVQAGFRHFYLQSQRSFRTMPFVEPLSTSSTAVPRKHSPHLIPFHPMCWSSVSILARSAPARVYICEKRRRKGENDHRRDINAVCLWWRLVLLYIMCSCRTKSDID